MKRLIVHLVEDFRCYWKSLLIIFFNLISIHCIVYWDTQRSDLYQMVNAAFFECFCFWFVVHFCKKAKDTLYNIFFGLSLFDFSLNLGNYLACKSLFTVDSFLLVMGTNTQETSDFFASYFTWGKFCIFVFMLSLIVYLYLKKTAYKLYNGILAKFLGAFLSLLFFVSAYNMYKNWIIAATIFPAREFFWYYVYEPCTSLKDYRHDVDLVETSGSHPEHIIVFIGESFSRNHSSLYGYNKNTNPLLSKLQEEQNLYVFSNCEAPEVNTSSAFKCIMSTYSSNINEKWYNCYTLRDVFSPYYHISWISNQKSSGAAENIQAMYAELSDYSWFSDYIYEDECYDDVIIPVLDSLCRKNSGVPELSIINVMGQHELFRNRFPVEWKIFDEKDYGEHPANQRLFLSDYDNATVYNDYVVYNVFNKYQNEDVLAFYFPDHGMDLYETDPELCGHGRKMNPQSVEVAKKIPFFIFVSDVYKAKHPDGIRKIEAYQDMYFNTENFIYMLMNITEWKFKDENLNKKFN